MALGVARLVSLALYRMVHQHGGDGFGRLSKKRMKRQVGAPAPTLEPHAHVAHAEANAIGGEAGASQNAASAKRG
ncbi:hypothetical protein YK56LOC_07250 [Caballeronia sp. HLA56]